MRRLRPRLDPGGALRVIEHGRNGLLFEPRNVDDLASKMLEAVDRPKMAAEARETIIERFNMDRNYRRYLELYREISI